MPNDEQYKKHLGEHIHNLISSYCGLVMYNIPLMTKGLYKRLSRFTADLEDLLENFEGTDLTDYINTIYKVYGTPEELAAKLSAEDPENQQFQRRQGKAVWNDCAGIYCCMVMEQIPVKTPAVVQIINDLRRNILASKKDSHYSRIDQCLAEIFNKNGDPAVKAEQIIKAAQIRTDIAPASAQDKTVKSFDKKAGLHFGVASKGESFVYLKTRAIKERMDKLDKYADKFNAANDMADLGGSVDDIERLTGLPKTALYLCGFGDPQEDMRDYLIPVQMKIHGILQVSATCVDDALDTLAAAHLQMRHPDYLMSNPEDVEVCADKELIQAITDMHENNALPVKPLNKPISSPLFGRDHILTKAEPEKILDMILGMLEAHMPEQKDDNSERPEPDGAKNIPEIDFQDDSKDDDDDATSVAIRKDKHGNVNIDIECDMDCKHCTLPDDIKCPFRDIAGNITGDDDENDDELDDF